MNSQTQILNQSYNLAQSNLSLGKGPNFAVSQANTFPSFQQPIYVNSFAPQQVSPSFRVQQSLGSQAMTSRFQPASQEVYSPNLYKNIQGFKERK